MSTSAFNQSFGLGYLNEQQRFVRDEKPKPITQPQSQFSDISGLQPLSIGSLDITPLERSVQDVPKLPEAQAMQPRVMSAEIPLQSNGVAHEYMDNEPVQEAVMEMPVPMQAAVQEMIVEPIVEQVEAVVETAKKISWLRNLRTHKILPIVVASIAFVSGLVIFGMTIHQNRQAAAQVATITEKSEAAADPETTAETPPSEAPVTAAAIGNYKVNPMEPRTVTIKKINVLARILPVGILKSGAMATPRNTNDAGWYNGSARPGEGGAVLLVGHVSGAVKAGVFYDLKKLAAGDVITVERGDGTKYDYKVVSKEQVPSEKVDTAKLLIPVTVGKPGLNIMTCGGKYMADKETYTDRVIVYTEQI